MMSFILRRIDPDVWHRVKIRAVADKVSLSDVARRFFEAYADGSLKLPKEKK